MKGTNLDDSRVDPNLTVCGYQAKLRKRKSWSPCQISQQIGKSSNLLLRTARIKVKTSRLRHGRWYLSEHFRFLEGVLLHSNDWAKVKEVVQTRSTNQIRSHTQKYLLTIISKYKSCSNQVNSDEANECLYRESFISSLSISSEVCESLVQLNASNAIELIEQRLLKIFKYEDLAVPDSLKNKSKGKFVFIVRKEKVETETLDDCILIEKKENKLNEIIELLKVLGSCKDLDIVPPKLRPNKACIYNSNCLSERTDSNIGSHKLEYSLNTNDAFLQLNNNYNVNEIHNEGVDEAKNSYNINNSGLSKALDRDIHQESFGTSCDKVSLISNYLTNYSLELLKIFDYMITEETRSLLQSINVSDDEVKQIFENIRANFNVRQGFTNSDSNP